MPVYVIPLLLFKLRRLLASPQSVLPRLLLSIARSSLFLSLYCTTGWAWMCLFRRAGDARGRQSHALLSGLLTGLCVLIEKRERRVELGLYVLSHSLYTAYHLAVDRHLTGYHPALLYPLLALSLTVLLTAFHADTAQQPSDAAAQPATPLLRPSYTSLFAYFLGRTRTHSAEGRAAQLQQQQHKHTQPPKQLRHHHHVTPPPHH